MPRVNESCKRCIYKNLQLDDFPCDECKRAYNGDSDMYVSDDVDTDLILDRISQSDLLCQLAEEAAELAHAALKLKRATDGNNPTPVSVEKAVSNLIEEIADVGLTVDICKELWHIQDKDIEKIKTWKKIRWAERLNKVNKT